MDLGNLNLLMVVRFQAQAININTTAPAATKNDAQFKTGQI